MSILVFCLASFFMAITSSLALQGVVSCPPGCRLLPSRVSSLALQGALQEGFCYGAVLFDVAKQESLRRFTVANKGCCFPARESTCCLTYSFVLCSVSEMRGSRLKLFSFQMLVSVSMSLLS